MDSYNKSIVFMAIALCWSTVFGLDVDVAVIEGDINIAGLFQVEEKDGDVCGQVNSDSVMVLEAARWYLEQLNNNNALPFKIGFRGYKTCGISSLAVEKTLEIIRLHENARSNGTNGELFVGMIGPPTSEEAKRVSSLLSSRPPDEWFLQISVSATATVLGDRGMYPNFFRVIPDDDKQIKTMVLLLSELGWNRLAVVYANDTYGRNGALSLQNLAKASLICISQMHAISIRDGDVSVEQINAILDTIMLQPPVIQGVVLFADRTIANKVLFGVNNKGVADVPVFLLSESVGIQGDVFRSSGHILQKSKGSIVVSAPYAEITTFTDYWLSLFTNMTLLEEKALLNPWLKDVFASETNCLLIEQCQPLTFEHANELFPMQSVYLKYSILAAHTMVKAVLNIYNEQCTTSQGRECLTSLRENFRPSMMTDEMKGMSVNFETDFYHSVVVEPLSSSHYGMLFRNGSEPVSITETELYQVYNYRRTTPGKNDFSLVKVGGMLDDFTLNIDVDSMRDYDSSGSEKLFPDLRRGQCPVGDKCPECIRQDITDLLLHIPGDLYIIGIAPINNKAIPGPVGCGSVRERNGYQVALAMQYGVETFNLSSEFAEYRQKFGGKRIGLIVLNSCNNDLTIVRKILNLHEKNGILLPNGDFLDLTNKILGYIGCLSSGVSLPVATQLTKIGMVQVSYSSTNPVLSDEQTYPYFMRIVTPDNVQAEAMMEVVKALKGEYIQVVHNEGAYGDGGKESVTASARKRGICIAQYIEVKESISYFEYYELIRRKPHAKIVIIFLNSNVLGGFLSDLNKQMTKGEFQFIGSEAWGKTADLLGYGIAKGSLTVTLEMDGIKGLSSFIQNKIPEKETSDPWLEQYIQSRQGCYFDWSFNKDKILFPEECSDDILPPSEKGSFQTDPWAVFATTSVYALLMGSGEYFLKSCRNSNELCQNYVQNPSGLVTEMKKVTMDIFGTGQIQIFDSVGDGNMGYQIYNIQEDYLESEGLKYERVGRFNLKTGLDINPANVAFPTSDEIISVCPNEQACADCQIKEEVKETPSEDSPDSLTIGLGSAAGVMAVAVVILIVVLILTCRRKHKESPYLNPVERPDALGKSDSPYHSEEIIIEETQQ